MTGMTEKCIIGIGVCLLVIAGIVAAFRHRTMGPTGPQNNGGHASGPETGATGKPANDDNRTWLKATLDMDGVSHELAYIKYDSPLSIRKDVPLKMISQETPEDLVNAQASLAAQGSGEEDFDHIIALHTGREYSRENFIRMYGGVEQYFEAAKHPIEGVGRHQLYGKIRYGQYEILVSGAPLEGRGMMRYVGIVTVRKGSDYYFISKSDLVDEHPIFRKLSEEQYSVVTGVNPDE